MSYNLPFQTKCLIIGALAEGASIRGLSRTTGIDRTTIINLSIRVGNACAKLMDESMRNLHCDLLQCDELWTFVRTKQLHTRPENRDLEGTFYVFLSFVPDTKLVPTYLVGKRDYPHTYQFISDLYSRVANRPQLSTDGFPEYEAAIQEVFGDEIDYGQVVKNFRKGPSKAEGHRKYSPPPLLGVKKRPVFGNVDEDKLSTSLCERQNLTVRHHMRRLTRLTMAFSKKLENLKSSVSLHLAYYNYVLVHSTIRCSPAMAHGITPKLWNVADLVDLSECDTSLN